MAGAGHLRLQMHFLDSCFLCRKPLADNRDVYMYRGDTAFCSQECRSAQIEADEATKRASARTRRPAHGPSPGRDVDGPRQECGKIQAWSVLAL